MGLWTLPPPDQQPATVQDLSAAVQACVLGPAVAQHLNEAWLFKYRYLSELVPIVSDASLQVRFFTLYSPPHDQYNHGW